MTVPEEGRPAETQRCSVCGSPNLAQAFKVHRREYVRCHNCGLTFLKAIDAEGEKAKYATDTYQRFENRQRLDLKKAVFERSLQEISRIKKPGRLLDVGCGNGLFLDGARRHGWETYGVELSPMACAHAREAYGLNVFHGELPEAGFRDAFFDVVTFYDVLDHLLLPLDHVVEAHRILKVGGLLALRVRNALFHVGLLRLLQSLEQYLVFHLYCFTPKTIRHLLATAGFSRIDVRNSVPTPCDPYSISPLLGDVGMQAIKRGIYLAAEVASLLSAHTLIFGPSLRIHAVKE